MAEVVTGLEELRELKTHRARLVIPHETLFRMADTSTDYVVLAVHADWIMERVELLVAHPDLAPVLPGCESPTLGADLGIWRELRVIDGKLYRRVDMEIGPPGELGRPVASEIREQLLARLQEILDSYAPEHRLEGVLTALAEQAHAESTPFSAARFLEWLR